MVKKTVDKFYLFEKLLIFYNPYDGVFNSCNAKQLRANNANKASFSFRTQIIIGSVLGHFQFSVKELKASWPQNLQKVAESWRIYYTKWIHFHLFAVTKSCEIKKQEINFSSVEKTRKIKKYCFVDTIVLATLINCFSSKYILF